MLTGLDAANDGPFTADYTVLTKFGNTTRPATVAVYPARRSVTVGDVRFITDNGVVADVHPRQERSVLDRRSTRLASATLRSRPTSTQSTQPSDCGGAQSPVSARQSRTPSSSPDRSATCVDVPVTGGVSVFCVLPNGPLAELDDGAVSINLTQYAPAIDESLFTTTTGP